MRFKLLRMPFPWSRRDPEPIEKINIAGQKIVLREKRISDAPDDYGWRVDEELATLDATRPLTMPYEDFLRYSTEEIDFPSPRSKRLGIDTKTHGKHIVNCMYYDIDLRRSEAELGIMIGDREYWSRGYGTDTVNTLLGHIFSTTTIGRVYLHTLEWNARARKSFAKSGFKELRLIRRGNLDFVQMEIFRNQWEQIVDAAIRETLRDFDAQSCEQTSDDDICK